MTDDHVPAQVGIAERLHTIRDHLRTGRFGQREVWEEWLSEAAAESEDMQRQIDEATILIGQQHREIERLNKDGADMAAIIRQQGFEIELAALRALEPKP